jgi:hypothetical protein
LQTKEGFVWLKKKKKFQEHGLNGFTGLCRDLVTSKVKLIVHFFIKHSIQAKVTFLIMYVDDIVVIGNDDEEIQYFKNSLANEFEKKT